MTSGDRKEYDALKAKFEGHFIIKGNVIFERAKFNLKAFSYEVDIPPQWDIPLR